MARREARRGAERFYVMRAWRMLLVVFLGLSLGCRGCGKKEPPAPTSTTLMTEPSSVAFPNDHAIAVDDVAVYWVRSDTTTTTIASTPKAGGPVSVLTTVTEPQGAWIKVNGASVYWITTSSAAPVVGTIWSVPKSGGSATALATGETNPHALAVDATNAYWFGGGDLRAAPRSGGAASTLQGGQRPVDLAVDGGDLYWLTCSRFDLSAKEIALKKISTRGGKATTLATFEADLLGLALGPTDVYVLTDEGHAEMPGKRAIQRVSRTGGAPTEVVVLATPTRTMVASGTDLYFSSEGDSRFWVKGTHASVFHVSSTGGALTEVGRPKGVAISLALDGTSVYWVDAEGSETEIAKATR